MKRKHDSTSLKRAIRKVRAELETKSKEFKKLILRNDD